MILQNDGKYEFKVARCEFLLYNWSRLRTFIVHDIELFGINIAAWIYAPVVYFVWVSVLLFIKKVTFLIMAKATQRTKSKLDDILLDALNFPATLLIFVSGALILERISTLDKENGFTQYFITALKAGTIVAIIFFLDKFLKNLIRTYASAIDAFKVSSDIVQGIVRALVIGLGMLILLDSFGVSVTPILASLGIGSLAVALGLQPTLENFFAGLQIVVDRQIMVGHFVQLDSGEEGYVDKIGWRSTWIRMLPNNMVIIPNKVLVNAKMKNFDYPDPEMAVLVQVGVSYGSDLKQVERVTTEVGEEIQKMVAGAVPSFKPFIRYHTFGDSSINFTVIMRGKTFVDQHLIKHEFIKRLHERYQKEGIVIPFPLRTIDISPSVIESLKTAVKDS